MDKMRQWSVLTLVGVVAVAAAGWFLVITPQRHKAADLRSQATTQETANAGLQSQVSQLEQQKKGLPAQQRRLADIAQKIPDNPALPALIRQLSAAADGAGVDLVSLAPGAPALVQVTAATPTTPTTPTGATGSSAATSAAAAAPQLAQIPVTITVKGSFYNIESFFSSLEKLNRAVLIPGWTLSVSQGTGTTGTTGSAGSGRPRGARAAPPQRAH